MFLGTDQQCAPSSGGPVEASGGTGNRTYGVNSLVLAQDLLGGVCGAREIQTLMETGR